LEQQTAFVLAGRVGSYREALPAWGLHGHFQCVWTHRLSRDDGGKAIAVVPDGCVDLLWRDGRLSVVGPDIVAAHPVLRPGGTILGLRFQPGAALNWLGLPMSEIVGREIELADLWGGKASEISMRLADVATLAGQANLLQELLLQIMPAIAAPGGDATMMFAFLQRHAGDADRKMSLLRDRLDVSERTLRRRSHDYFGYGAKTLDRILRFQRFQTLVGASCAPLAIVAAEAGYADQAHLSREIKSLCGMSAATFAGQIRSPKSSPVGRFVQDASKTGS
jgi:AraC-like DNA-binding protein